MKLKLNVIAFSVCSLFASVSFATPGIINKLSSPVTLISEKSSSSDIVVNAGQSVLLPDGWTAGDDKQVYYKILGPGGLICTHVQYGTKRVNAIYEIQGNPATCTVTNGDFPPPPPPPEPSKEPTFQNIPENVVVKPGQHFETIGYASNPEGVGGLPIVTVHNIYPWINVTEQPEGNSVKITINGTPTEAHANSVYGFNITAANEFESKTQQVDIAVGSNEITPRTISAWIYDASGGNTVPGQFVGLINQWNNTAKAAGRPENMLNELYTYGTDMEMYTDNNELQTYYHVPDTYNMTTNSIKSTYGPSNAALYKHLIPDAQYVSPIVDGRIDTGYLQGFNNLSETHARGYADLVAQQFCVDKNVMGPHLDVEPMNLNKPAQVHFYDQLTKNLAGDNPNLPLCDKSKDRFTSVFTFAHMIENAQNEPGVQDLLSRPNFTVIDSLYDLTHHHQSTYRARVQAEVDQLVYLANKYHFNFKFGIPASCSFNECAADGNNIAYVKDSLAAIKQADVCSNPHFKGLAIWAFDDETVTWKGVQHTIKPPSPEVIDYLATSAWQDMCK